MQSFELRTSARRNLRVPIRVEVLGRHWSLLELYAINLSSSGLCLQATAPEPPGDELQLRFRLGPGSKLIRTRAEVAWVACDGDQVPGMRFCEIGLRFLELAAEDELELLEFVRNAVSYRPEEHETGS